MSESRFARVVVDVRTRGISTSFDYRIPEELVPRVRVGAPVIVPFSGRDVVGWVVELIGASPYDNPRDIDCVLGASMFDSAAADLAMWIAEEYVSALPDAVRLLLPPGVNFKAELVDVDGGTAWQLVRPTTTAVDERWVTLADESYRPRSGATSQRAVLDAVSSGPLRMAELRDMLGAGAAAAVTRLADLGALRIEQRRRFRTPGGRNSSALQPDTLSDGQADALRAIFESQRSGGGVVLVDGVTGSGKTEVYLQAIEDVLARDGGAIVLVPEISLTPQTVGRFRARFGEQIAVLHSRLSAGERFDEWDRCRCGQAQVVVGARSALFAPIRNLRLIVIDEEHEHSYKQGSSPRYHARDVASRMAMSRGLTLVLGSGTPSMESLHAAESGIIERVAMPERVAGGSMPPVTIVDMGAEFTEGHRSMFSRVLTSRMKEVVSSGSKAVLLLNRRGFASFLLCRECGHVPTCDSCSTSMTYHDEGHVLACHHCDARRAVPQRCPDCGSVFLRRFGAGTQRVESELMAAFPELPVIRMDADTTKGKGGHERRLAEFESHQSAVLLGTQMVAKGLDYPEVTLVGVLNADTTLHLPDFRASERTYQMLAQVAGRAGRGPAGGNVVIQTYWPDHPAIRAVAGSNPAGFLETESATRRELGFPPYGRIANIVFAGPDEDSVRAASGRAAERLKKMVPGDVMVLGPSPAPLARLKRAFRWHLLVKSPPGTLLPSVLREALGSFRSDGITMAIDIDPVDTL
ncbi:MAG: primosomal protein N' [Coriobacteriia bacterium]|nr:primosomal protein N' [Coriobacteriia bacterium]